MQGTADSHHDITNALLPQADPVFDDATTAALVAGLRICLPALQSSILSVTLFSDFRLRWARRILRLVGDARGLQASAQSRDALKRAPAEHIGLDKQIAAAGGKNVILCTLGTTHT